MKIGAMATAIVFSLLLAAFAFADAPSESNKWRIELSGQALTSGALVFRVTPHQGEATDVTVNIRSGRDENNVARDVRDALATACADSQWSEQVRRCLHAAGDHVGFETCQQDLSLVQRRALDRAARGEAKRP